MGEVTLWMEIYYTFDRHRERLSERLGLVGGLAQQGDPKLMNKPCNRVFSSRLDSRRHAIEDNDKIGCC